MLRFTLYWHTETDDINLGDAYADVLPTIGMHVTKYHPDVPHVGWKVVNIQLDPASPGSMTVLAVQSGRPAPDGQVGMWSVFVEPAEGLFHAGEPAAAEVSR